MSINSPHRLELASLCAYKWPAMNGRLAELKLAGMKFIGYSLAGEETVVAAPELNVCFDIGKAPQEVVSIDHVLLTHGHMDHAAGIAYYFSQRHFLGCDAGTALVPPSLERPLKRLVRVWADIEGHPSPANIVPARPGEDFTIRKNLVARAFAVPHGSETLGFAVIEKRHKLKPEFAPYTGPELAALKRKGVQIEYEVEVPLVTYCCDAAPGQWIELPWVRQSKVLILECTFFEPDHIERARQGQHIHAVDMPEIMKNVSCEHVLIIHLSRRTPLRLARKVLHELLGEEQMARISFLMHPRNFPPRGRGRRHQSSAAPPTGSNERPVRPSS